ncbi:actinodefensin-associated protein A [Actinomyces sp.]|uniref:actinodefensin-associated protein A n=1 Tax=Actinomyces sp. TaxID=29317 RepID=UPI0026DB9242|nr:actinodefensin-associated protein A [Actinomyces sp.]MDO4901058.1 actinodefensin-associated protein A [Actinomyces sp.]
MNPQTTSSASPWTGATEFQRDDVGSWKPVTEETLAADHASASLMFVIAGIAGVRPPFGHSLFDGVLCRTPGTRLEGDAITPYEQSQYGLESGSFGEAEQVLAKALHQHGVSGDIRSSHVVDDLVTRYVNELATAEAAHSSEPPAQAEARDIDLRGIRDLIGAVEAEQEQQQSRGGFLDRLLRSGRQHSKADQKEHQSTSEDAVPEIEVSPQWLTVDAINMIDVARIVSLASWQEAMKGLSPRVCQVLWTAADNPATSQTSAYRPAHDPQVIAAFAAVPYEERSASIRPGVRTHDAAICRCYGRDPIDDGAAARLQAVHEAGSAWSTWQEELADGTLAARGLIDTEGLAQIGQDPFLRQQYAPDVKKTVETERWLTSWLDAGGLLKE